MNPLTARGVLRRFLVLTALRWVSTGLLIPILVLLARSRGLSLTEIGLVFGVQGFVVLLLELPTGGLADSLGRRPVLILAGLVGTVSLVVLYAADSVGMFVLVSALQGVYRALDSGPLEAWFVDASLAADPEIRIERGLGAGSAVLSASIAIGALLSGALVALDPFESIPTLGLPVLVAIGLSLVNVIGVVGLMSERSVTRATASVGASVRAVPSVVGDGLRLLGRSPVLIGLVAVEAAWAFAMVTFETLFPLRLSEVTGDPTGAAALMGPVSAAAWFVSAAGAAGIIVISARIGVARTAAALRLVQAATIVGMGLLLGPIGVVAAYLGSYLTHGASNPMHMTLLHREVDGPNRATVLSINSMVGQPAGAIGAIVLASLADATSISTAMIVGGVICALAAPFYLPAWRAERRRAEDRAADAPTTVS